jgi:hypothetical protein
MRTPVPLCVITGKRYGGVLHLDPYEVDLLQ